MTKLPLLGAAACTLLAAFGAWGVAIEAAPFRAAARPEPLAIAALVEAPRLPAATSAFAARKALDDCLLSAVLPATASIPAAVREATASACMERAIGTVEASPLHADAWMTLAVLLDRAGDVAGSEAAALVSREASPSQEVIARRRFRLLADRSDFSSPVERMLDADMAVLARTADGTLAIAQRYLDGDADFRDRVASVAATLPPDDQEAFLARLQRDVRSMTGGS